jgi:hypothetical protein
LGNEDLDMEKDIDPKLRKIKEYLTLDKGGPVFRIPEYQRAYSWGIDQCDKLLQDVESFMESDGTDPYFFGTIILDCSNNQRNLIDGQQRTSSFLLLLKAILFVLEKDIPLTNGEDSAALKKGLNTRRDEILRILYFAEEEETPNIIANPSLIKDIPVPIENVSINELHKNELEIILHAVTYEEAEQNVYKIPRKQKDNKYTDFFRNFKFFYTKMDSKTPSQLNEFAKAFLNKCQVIEIKSWNVEQAIVMFNSLNSTGLPLSDADVLSAQLYSKAKGSQDFVKKWKEFYDNVEVLNGKGIADLQTLFSQYMYILRAKDSNADVSLTGVRKYFLDSKRLEEPMVFVGELNKIAEDWEKVSGYPLVKLLLKFNLNARFFAATYMQSHGIDDIEKPFESLLRLFAILEIVDSGYSSKQFKQFLFQENIRMANGAITPDQIANDFKTHICSNWTREQLVSEIKNYRENTLVLLNEYVYCKRKGLIFYFDDHYNIEHIMPSSGKNRQVIRVDAGIADENEFRDIVDQLGNKIPLEEDINKSIGNEWFKTKKQNTITSKTGYQKSNYSIAKALVAYSKDTWGKEDIALATEKAANRIADFLIGDDEGDKKNEAE